MDWPTFAASVISSLLGGGLIVGLLPWRLRLWGHRHRVEIDKWDRIQQSYREEI